HGRALAALLHGGRRRRGQVPQRGAAGEVRSQRRGESAEAALVRLSGPARRESCGVMARAVTPLPSRGTRRDRLPLGSARAARECPRATSRPWAAARCPVRLATIRARAASGLLVSILPDSPARTGSSLPGPDSTPST